MKYDKKKKEKKKNSKIAWLVSARPEIWYGRKVFSFSLSVLLFPISYPQNVSHVERDNALIAREIIIR